MKKAIVYTAHNGTIIVDDTPQAEIRLENIKYMEECILKERRRVTKHKQGIAKSILRKVACFMV